MPIFLGSKLLLSTIQTLKYTSYIQPSNCSFWAFKPVNTKVAVCSIQIWYWEVCLEHLLGHHLGHFWYIIWSHVCGATCISDAGFCGRLCQYLMWHIVFSFYNSQNYSAFYYEEVTAFELSTSKVKTAVSTNWLDFRQKLFPQSLRGGEWLKSYLAEFHLNNTFLTQRLPLIQIHQN